MLAPKFNRLKGTMGIFGDTFLSEWRRISRFYNNLWLTLRIPFNVWLIMRLIVWMRIRMVTIYHFNLRKVSDLAFSNLLLMMGSLMMRNVTILYSALGNGSIFIVAEEDGSIKLKKLRSLLVISEDAYEGYSI